jgi:hypothetical protein
MIVAESPEETEQPPQGVGAPVPPCPANVAPVAGGGSAAMLAAQLAGSGGVARLLEALAALPAVSPRFPYSGHRL